MADHVGQQLGNYRLLRQLGAGAFASVYLGEHQYLERPAAVKVLHVQMEPKAHEAFLREARTIAHLDHLHIMRVLDFGIEGRTPYLVMEYTPGGTLRDLHPRGSRLSFEQIVSYVQQIASALDYAHQQGVIHRDIKPENVLLAARGEVVLSDFGIAVVQQNQTSLSTQQSAGTPLYMAPEQILGKPCPASDQYALGVIVYEWITGEPPFWGSLFEVWNRHLNEAPPSLRERLPDLPAAVEDAVLGALAKDPRQRFATVQDFASVLEEVCFATQLLEAVSFEHRVQSSSFSASTADERYSAAPLQQPKPDLLSPAMPSQIITQRPFPISIVTVSAPADHPYLEHWEAHLRPLVQAGALTVWSELYIRAGMARQQQIDEHLDQADLIVLFVSADFFSSDDCIALMKRALQRRQHGEAHVVPLLLRLVEWDISPLASLSCIPSNGRPITAWMDRDAAFDLCIRDLRRLLGHRMPPGLGLPQTTTPWAVAQRARQLLLRKVRSFWIEGVLNHSLHGGALPALGLEAQPDAVADPWHLELQQPETTPRPLPPGTRITQVYDEAEGELLILGTPGAGKTTLLLELARALLERAEHDEQHPMPVVFNLSSWAIKRQRLADWLVEELNSRYQIPPELAQAIVETDQILPLLDGLDEMAANRRTACIEAINTYRLEHGLYPLVVCSRSADYLAQTARVRLGSAVMVQPLTPRQVIDYLSAVGSQVEGLRAALRLDRDLQALATAPLMLNIFILAYQDVPLRQIAPLGTLPDKRRQIFASYVQRMLIRHSATSRYITEQALPWLSFLAQEMKRRNQSVFYMESIQPDWLIDKRMLRTYDWLAVHLPYMLIGVLVSLAPYLYFFPQVWTPFLPEFILIGGLLGWLLGGGGTSEQSLARTGRKARGWYWPLQQLGLAALLGSGVAVSFWVSDGPPRGLVAGLSFGVCCLLLMLLLRKSNMPQAPVRRTQQRPSIGKVALNALLVGLLFGLSNAAGLSLHAEPRERWIVGLLTLLPSGLSGGLLSSLLLGRHAGVQPTDRLNWTWLSLSKSLFSKHHIKWALLITGIGLPFFGTIVWLIKDIKDAILLGPLLGFAFGLGYWLLLGFFRGVRSTTIDDQLRMIPNQGIRYSLFNALGYGLVVAFLMGLGGWQLTTSWPIGLIIGLSVGLLAGLFNGGLACLRHYMLRILLWHSGAIPWDYRQFLDAAAERMLLTKIGGGYIFLHRLLLDHLATLGIGSTHNEWARQRNTTLTALLPCGHEAHPNARFCSVCGAAVRSTVSP